MMQGPTFERVCRLKETETFFDVLQMLCTCFRWMGLWRGAILDDSKRIVIVIPIMKPIEAFMTPRYRRIRVILCDGFGVLYREIGELGNRDMINSDITSQVTVL